MADYARRGGLDVQPAPFVCNFIDARLFGMAAHHGALQDLCDRTFNIPSGGQVRYAPYLNAVVLTFQRMNRLYSSSLDANAPVALTYTEACFWVMVQDKARDDAPIELLVPYIFLDNSLAVATGREIYGFPKEHAVLEIPSQGTPGFVECLTAATLANQAPTTVGGRLLTCGYVGIVPFPDSMLLEPPPPDIFRSTANLDSDIEVAHSLAAFVQLILGGRLPFVFLREIRALGGGPGCDLQQIVSANAALVNIGVPSFQGRFRLQIGRWASHPVAQDLGLALAPDNGLNVIGASINFGFELGPGTVRWP